MEILSADQRTRTLSSPTQAVLLALGVYLLWTAATYLLEGRISLVHNSTQPDGPFMCCWPMW